MIIPIFLGPVGQAGVLGVMTHVVLHNWRSGRTLEVALCAVLFIPGLLGAISGQPIFNSVVAAYTVYIASLCASVVLYRLSPLHPLARYPGPVLRKITKLTGVLSVAGGHQHFELKRLHDRYGPVIRTGPNELSIVDVDAVTAVLGAGGLPKGDYYEGRRDPNAPGNLLALTGEAHANRRRLWNRGMSSESLAEYETMITKRAGQLVERFEGMSGAVDLAQWIGYFTFDFMGDMAFGGGFEMLRDGGDVNGFWTMINDFARSSAMICHVPWLSQPLQKLPFTKGSLQKMRKTGIAYATARVQRGAEMKDLWYHLSDEVGLEKETPPTRDVVADGVLAIVAGSDTTVSALSSLFYFLISNPECYELAREEVDRVFPPGADALDASKHDQLTYLTACLNESLRLHPPVATNGPRQVPRGTDGKTIAGCFVPEGTQVYVPPYVLHRDARYWPRSPNAFVPDRWLHPDANHTSLAFIPFSYGPANCVGRNIARREMLMLASLLLQRFTMRFAEGFDWERWPEALHDHFISARGPLLVTMERRC